MNTDAAFWNNLAADYAQKPVDNPDAFERKIAVTRALMSPDSTVLDIGCGTGSLALRLADAGAHVHGLDISEEMVRIAQQKAAAQAVDNVSFHVGPFDASFTAFGRGSLDGVCAYSVLHLLDDRAAALAQIFDLLKPGGFFVSSTVCLGSRFLYAPILWLLRKLGKAPRVQIFDQTTLEGEIKAAGFVDVNDHDVGAKDTTAFIVAKKPW